MPIGKCLKCDKIVEMTEDHVIPQWFNKALINFDLPQFQHGATEYVCKDCNQNKGGKIVYSDERVRGIMKPFIQRLVEKVREFEADFKP